MTRAIQSKASRDRVVPLVVRYSIWPVSASYCNRVPAQPTLGSQRVQDVLLRPPGQHFGVEGADREEVTLSIPGAVADERVEVRMPVELVSVRWHCIV